MLQQIDGFVQVQFLSKNLKVDMKVKIGCELDKRTNRLVFKL